MRKDRRRKKKKWEHKCFSVSRLTYIDYRVDNTTIPEKGLVIEPSSSNQEDRYSIMKSKIVRPLEHRFGRIKKWEEGFNDFAKKNQQFVY